MENLENVSRAIVENVNLFVCFFFVWKLRSHFGGDQSFLNEASLSKEVVGRQWPREGTVGLLLLCSVSVCGTGMNSQYRKTNSVP